WFGNVICKSIGFGPCPGLAVFDDQNCFRGSVGKIVFNFKPVTFEGCAGTDENAVKGLVCLRRLYAWRAVNAGHLVEQREVVRAIPRFLEMKLTIELVLFNVWQDRDAPT